MTGSHPVRVGSLNTGCAHNSLTGQAAPNKLKQPTVRPTMRWVLQCFEGLYRLPVRTPTGHQVRLLHFSPLHEQVLTLLGSVYP